MSGVWYIYAHVFTAGMLENWYRLGAQANFPVGTTVTNFAVPIPEWEERTGVRVKRLDSEEEAEWRLTGKVQHLLEEP